MKTVGSVAILLTGLAILTGCSKEPTTEIQAAQQSAGAAQASGAAEYAPDSYARVNEAQSKLDMELQAQSKKFKPLRSYKHATELAQAVTSAATQASADAEAAKKQAMDDAMAAINDAKTSLQTAMTELESAPKGKGSQVDLDAMKSDLMQAQNSMTEVEAAFSAQQYKEAKAKAEAAKASAENVLNAIHTAAEAQQAAKSRKG